MCGIFAAFGLTGDPRKNRQLVARLTRRMLHRGPDWTNVWGDAADPDRQTFLAHLRLALVGRGESGDQPLHTADGVHWVVNGEIYNFEQLCQDHGLERRTPSDSEVVGLLYQKYGPDFVHLLDGMFVFALYDETTGTYMAGRDHMGISPLYMGRGRDAGAVFLSSEMKGLSNCDAVEHYEIFPPGHQLVMATAARRGARAHPALFGTFPKIHPGMALPLAFPPSVLPVVQLRRRTGRK